MKSINHYFEDGVISFLIFTLISFIIIKIIHYIIKKRLVKINASDLAYRIISLTVYSTWGYITLLQIIPLRAFAISLLASGGVFALMIGFASQESVSNIISGVFILIFKPFIIGDIIKIENGLIIGTVENITLRHTIIRSFENTKQVIGNARLNALVIENISNFTNSKGSPLQFTITVNSDVKKSVEIIQSVISNNKKIIDKGPVLITNITDLGIEIKCMIFGADIKTTNLLLSELRIEVVQKFQENNIIIATRNYH